MLVSLKEGWKYALNLTKNVKNDLCPITYNGL
jgi:hypothetical protein